MRWLRVGTDRTRIEEKGMPETREHLKLTLEGAAKVLGAAVAKAEEIGRAVHRGHG